VAESLPVGHGPESPATTNRPMEEVCERENLKESACPAKAVSGPGQLRIEAGREAKRSARQRVTNHDRPPNGSRKIRLPRGSSVRSRLD
jgi:hypothetical protein